MCDFLVKVEEDTSQSMKMLLDLDAIKSRMKAASDALQVRRNKKCLHAFWLLSHLVKTMETLSPPTKDSRTGLHKLSLNTLDTISNF